MFYASQHSLDIEFFIEKQCLTREGDLLGNATHNLIDLSTHLTAQVRSVWFVDGSEVMCFMPHSTPST